MILALDNPATTRRFIECLHEAVPVLVQAVPVHIDRREAVFFELGDRLSGIQPLDFRLPFLTGAAFFPTRRKISSGWSKGRGENDRRG